MLQFTIRDVAWFTVIVAVGLGWILDHQRLAPLRDDAASFHALQADLRNQGYELEYGKGWQIYEVRR